MTEYICIGLLTMLYSALCFRRLEDKHKSAGLVIFVVCPMILLSGVLWPFYWGVWLVARIVGVKKEVSDGSDT